MKRFILFLLLFPSICFADGYVIGWPSGACSATYGSELNASENAAFPSASDFDATTGLTSSGLAAFASVSTSSPYLGTYHIEATADTGDDRFYQLFTGLTPGQLYRITAYAKHGGSGGDWSMSVSNSSFIGSATTRQTYTSADTTYTLYDKYFRFGDYTKYIVFTEASATNDGTVYFDNMSLKAVTSPCLGSELYTTANAASITNEADATTGWTVVDADTFASTTNGTPPDGTYQIQVSSNGTPTASARAYFDLSTLGLVDGTHYLISASVKHVGSGGTWYIGFASVTTSLSANLYTLGNTDTSDINIGIEVIYSSTFRYLMAIEFNASNDGGVYIDAITAKEIVSK